jgi:glycosyltransferase involved in cell wall biosynthesis
MSRKVLMRILHLSNHVKNSGNGIVNVLVDLACAQAEGHAVGVASVGGDFEQLLNSRGVTCFALDQRRRPLTLARAALQFRKIVRAFRPDVVHAHMTTGALLAYSLRWKLQYSLVTTVHNEFYKSATIMGVGDCVIAVSDAVARSMVSRGVARNKVKIVRNGPLGSIRKAKYESSVPMKLQHPAVVTVGGMYERKGIGPLLEAFARVLEQQPSTHLYLVGDGPDRTRFEIKARELGLSKTVHFEGFQPDPWRYLRAGDVFVLASLAEPFGLVLAEAREAGLAIVATNVGGIPEALDRGEAGILVPPNDPPALADAVCELLGNKDNLSRARTMARQNLDWLKVKRMNDETLTVYADIISRPA